MSYGALEDENSRDTNFALHVFQSCERANGRAMPADTKRR